MSSSKVHIWSACAGSGKTTALVNVMKQLMEKGYKAEEIYTTTFTAVGVRELRRRSGLPKDNISTIHSLCLHLLPNWHDVLDHLMERKDFNEFSAMYSMDISTETVEDAETYAFHTDNQYLTLYNIYRFDKTRAKRELLNHVDIQKFLDFVTKIEEYKKSHGLYDFTDLLIQVIERDDIESKPHRALLIDEAQDLSKLQWQILYKVFPNTDFIGVFGDVHQAIYDFAGADPSILRDMRGEQHTLTKSYRVSEHVARFVRATFHIDIYGAHENGQVKYAKSLDEIAVPTDKKVFILTRTRSQFKGIAMSLARQGLNFYIGTEKYFGLKHKRLLGGNQVPIDEDGVHKVRLMDAKQKFGYAYVGTVEEQLERRRQTWNMAALADKFPVAAQLVTANPYVVWDKCPDIHVDTIYGAKGAEADLVILFTDSTALISRTTGIECMAENNVFYVGCTRSKGDLILVQAQTKYAYPPLQGGQQ